ncbi:MAG: SDR family oxidoreductase [Desulfomonilia bacterium]|jgi:UDP-glucose 4-epimerase
MKTIFITGVSGYFGRKLVSTFEGRDEVERIIGVDVRPPGISSRKLEFIRCDVRGELGGILSGRGIDCAIHAAYILDPIHDIALMEDININGTKNVLNSCARAGVKHILDCSSTTAYGFHPDNPEMLTEESALRGNEDFTYAKNKREIEGFLEDFQAHNPDIRLTVIRPCFVVGPGFDNSLARHLRKRFVPIGTHTSPMQFIHEDDLAEIIWLLIEKGKEGVFNLVADGTMTFEEMIHSLGNRPVRVPNRLLSWGNALFWFLRVSWVTEFPSPCLNLMQYRWVASNDKIKRELVYTFKYTTKEAFEDFARCVRRDRVRTGAGEERP